MDIVYEGCFIPGHRYLTPLTFSNIKYILKYSRRALSRKCRFVTPEKYNKLSVRRLLSKDRGLMIVYCSGHGFFHAVSLYRTKNGEFVYYNSTDDTPIPPIVIKYIQRHKVNHVYDVGIRTQYLPYRSCAYHSLTFLNFVSSYRRGDLIAFLSSFIEYMAGNTDGKAIACVQEIIREFPHKIDLSNPSGCPYSSLLPGFSPASIGSRKRKLDVTDTESTPKQKKY